MNKTVSISLASFSFIVEEHAYIKLSDYLAALKKSLEPDEVTEVMHDIELRIVEIFKDRMDKREVVNDDDVEAVIALIGTPEQIDEQEQEYTAKEKSTSAKAHPNFSSQKQLFRDPNHKRIGGVASGLAAYLGVDIVWIRLAFVLLLFARGFGLLLYIILWIVIPVAKTAGDFLKMKGEELNFDNLKEQSGKIVKFTTDSSEKVSQYYHDNRQNISSAGDALLRVLAIIGGIFTSLLAITFFLGSVAILFGGFSFGPGAEPLNFSENINFYLNSSTASTLIMIFGFLSLIIPAIIFTLLTIKLFSPKTKIKFFGWLAGALVVSWILLGIFIGINFSKTQMNYNGTNEESTDISINTTSDTLVVAEQKVNIPANFNSYWNGIYSNKKIIYDRDWIGVDIEREDDLNTPYLVVKKSASGYNKPLQMNVPVRVEGNKINLPNYISYPYEDRMRSHRVNYELHVPKNFKVLKEGRVHLDNEDDDDDDYDDWDNWNGNINLSSDDDSIIIINNKKIALSDLQNSDSEEYRKLRDSLKNGDINLKNGDKEIKIKNGKLSIKNGNKEIKIKIE